MTEAPDHRPGGSSTVDGETMGGAPDAPSASRPLQRAFVALKVAVTAGILFVVAKQVDLAALGKSFASVDPGLLAVAMLHLLLIPVLGGVRWKLILEAMGQRFRVGALTRVFWVGMLFNQILPSSSGGDAVRVWMIWRAGSNLGTAVNSTLLERGSMVLTLVAMAVAVQPLFVQRVDLGGAQWIMPGLLAAGLLGLALLVPATRLLVRFRVSRPAQVLLGMANDARRVFLSRRVLPLLATCLLTHLNLSVAAWWIGQSLGLPLAFVDYLVFIPIITILTILPISIGGWGVREGLTVALLATVDVPEHDALAFSVLFGLSMAASSLPGLILWWRKPEKVGTGNFRNHREEHDNLTLASNSTG
ncbi:lysylphosphatidylglycerol synthase transmembrane domain-containing protein [Azospirillum brasilense]|nr:lysylphosphatidylglycerol synthase transmembrane domain-containing protein [Azospirillum brasilense]